jgi:hypothetical protein
LSGFLPIQTPLKSSKNGENYDEFSKIRLASNSNDNFSEGVKISIADLRKQFEENKDLKKKSRNMKKLIPRLRTTPSKSKTSSGFTDKSDLEGNLVNNCNSNIAALRQRFIGYASQLNLDKTNLPTERNGLRISLPPKLRYNFDVFFSIF